MLTVNEDENRIRDHTISKAVMEQTIVAQMITSHCPSSNIYLEELSAEKHARTSTMFRTRREDRRATNHSITVNLCKSTVVLRKGQKQ